ACSLCNVESGGDIDSRCGRTDVPAGGMVGNCDRAQQSAAGVSELIAAGNRQSAVQRCQAGHAERAAQAGRAGDTERATKAGSTGADGEGISSGYRQAAVHGGGAIKRDIAAAGGERAAAGLGDVAVEVTVVSGQVAAGVELGDDGTAGILKLQQIAA